MHGPRPHEQIVTYRVFPPRLEDSPLRSLAESREGVGQLRKSPQSFSKSPVQSVLDCPYDPGVNSQRHSVSEVDSIDLHLLSNGRRLLLSFWRKNGHALTEKLKKRTKL